MKRIPAYLAAAAVALFWAADGRAANDPDEYLARQQPYLRVPVAGRLPTSFQKLSGSLVLNDYDLSCDLPKNFLRIAEELNYPDSQKLAGRLGNSFTRIAVSLPERTNTDDIARFNIYNRVPLSGRLGTSFLKIASQYPTPAGD